MKSCRRTNWVTQPRYLLLPFPCAASSRDRRRASCAETERDGFRDIEWMFRGPLVQLSYVGSYNRARTFNGLTRHGAASTPVPIMDTLSILTVKIWARLLVCGRTNWVTRPRWMHNPREPWTSHCVPGLHSMRIHARQPSLSTRGGMLVSSLLVVH